MTFYLLINWAGFFWNRYDLEDRFGAGVDHINIPNLDLVGFSSEATDLGNPLDLSYIKYLKEIQKHPGMGYSDLAKRLNVRMETAYRRVRYLTDRSLVRLAKGDNEKHLLHVDYNKLCIVQATHLKDEELSNLTLERVIQIAKDFSRQEIKLI
jgi:hypothetical protein